MLCAPAGHPVHLPSDAAVEACPPACLQLAPAWQPLPGSPCPFPDGGAALQELRKHAKKVMQMLGHVIAMLHDLDKLVPQLKDLASRHIGYGVKLEEYEVCGFASQQVSEPADVGHSFTMLLTVAQEHGGGSFEFCMVTDG